MKTILIKPIPSGQYVAFYGLPVSGATPITFPFPPSEISLERKLWEASGFRVVIQDSLNLD